MTTFVVIAAFMTLLAVLVVVWPLVKRGNRRIGLGVVSAVLIAGAAAALYSAWSTWDWHAPAVQAETPPDVAAMVARLEQRLAADPKNIEGWQMLGRSYLALERFPDAAGAYDKAVQLSGGRNVDALLGMGEALSMGAGGQITRPAADIFERAIALDPKNPKALLFGGFAAAVRGDNALARIRWLSLRAMNPPAQIAQMLDARIASLDASSVAASGDGAPGGPSDGGRAGTSAQQVTSSGGIGEASGAVGEASVTISISPQLKALVKAETPMFVFAREPGMGGPPLAVKRLSSAAIGTTIKLSAADAMMSGRSLQIGHKVDITARISFAGQPLPAAGDLYGELTYDVGKDGVRDLVIDRVAH